MLDAVGCPDPVRSDRLDRRGFQGDVAAVERGQIRIVKARPFTPEGVGRRELAPCGRIEDLHGDILAGSNFQGGGTRNPSMKVRQHRERRLDERLARQAGALPDSGHFLQACASEATEGEVRFGQTPDGGALEDRQMLDVGCDLGDHLHGRRSGADDPDPLTRHGHLVVPSAGVHRRALEGVDAVDLGQLGLAQRSTGVNQPACGDIPRTGRDQPVCGLCVERGLMHAGGELQVGCEVVFVDDLLCVQAQLTARCVAT